MGLGGVGDSKGLLESELRQRHIRWLVNSKITEVRDGEMDVDEMDEDGKPKKRQVLPFGYSMVLPAFTGVDAVRGIEGLCNPRGFVLIDSHQRNLCLLYTSCWRAWSAMSPPSVPSWTSACTRTGWCTFRRCRTTS